MVILTEIKPYIHATLTKTNKFSLTAQKKLSEVEEPQLHIGNEISAK